MGIGILQTMKPSNTKVEDDVVSIIEIIRWNFSEEAVFLWERDLSEVERDYLSAYLPVPAIVVQVARAARWIDAAEEWDNELLDALPSAICHRYTPVGQCASAVAETRVGELR